MNRGFCEFQVVHFFLFLPNQFLSSGLLYNLLLQQIHEIVYLFSSKCQSKPIYNNIMRRPFPHHCIIVTILFLPLKKDLLSYPKPFPLNIYETITFTFVYFIHPNSTMASSVILVKFDINSGLVSHEFC